MSFCEFCGTKLENGAVCACPEARAHIGQAGFTAPPPPPAFSQAPPPAYNQTASAPPYNMPQKPLVPVCPRCNVQAPKGAGQFCGTCGSPYQMMVPPRPLLTMCPRCNVQAPRGAGQFCGTCGSPYQVMEAPTFENGGICPNCNLQVPSGSGDYCTHCGRAFFGGSSFKMPENINLQSAGELMGGLTKMTRLNTQRIVFIAVAVIGLLFVMFPWHNTEAWTLARTNIGTFTTICKVISAICFIGIAAICFTGDKMLPLGKIKYTATAAGIIGALDCVFYAALYNATDVAKYDYGSVVFCVYICLIIALLAGILPFVKKLER